MSDPEFGQEAAGMEFELGQTYAGYEILQLVRSSRSAHEYRVRNVFAQREETLKVLPSASQDNREIADAFLREARILARVSHPNIVTFFNAQPIDGRMVMTTEFIDVEPLSARLRAGVMPWREALDAADQLLAALASLHEANVVHLDITPDSVVCQRGVWKLVNFEKARVVNGVPLTGNGAVSGNVKYISPEQVKGGTIDRRSDIYSLGTVLYQMLCGRTPFDSNSQFELMLAHVSAIPAPPSQFCKDLPAGVDEVVLSALAKEPASRPDAQHFAAELKKIAETVPLVLESQPPVAVEDVVPAAAVLETAIPEAIQVDSPVFMEAEARQTVEAGSSVAVEAGASEGLEIQSAVATAELLPEQSVSEPASPEATESQAPVALASEVVTVDSPVSVEEAHFGQLAVEFGAAEPMAQAAVPVGDAIPAHEATEAPEVAALYSPVAQIEAAAAHAAIEVPEPVQARSIVASDEAAPAIVVFVPEHPESIEDVIPEQLTFESEAAESIQAHSPVAVEEAIPAYVVEPADTEPIDVGSDVVVDEALSAHAAVEALSALPNEAVDEVVPEQVTFKVEAAEPIQAQSALSAEQASPAPVALELETAEPLQEQPAVLVDEVIPSHAAVEAAAPATQPLEDQPAATFEEGLPEHASYGAVSSAVLDEPVPAHVAAAGAEAGPAPDTHSAVPTDVAGLAALAVAVTQMVRESEALPPLAESSSTAEALPETLEYQSDSPAVPETVHERIVAEPMLFDKDELEPAPLGVINAVAELMPDAVESRPAASASVHAIESVPALLGPAGVEASVTNQPLAEVVSEASTPQALVGPDPTLQANLWAAAAMVSKAAEVAPPPHTEPVSVVQVVPTAAAAAATASAAAAKPAAPVSEQESAALPAEIAAARQPDITHWIMLGSAAAFLFIVWIAIYFGFRW